MRAAGRTVGEVCQALGVGEQTYHHCKSKYHGMDGGEVKCLRAPDEENRRLDELMADQALDIQTLRDAAEGNF